jgi:hypothetical protein
LLGASLLNVLSYSFIITILDLRLPVGGRGQVTLHLCVAEAVGLPMLIMLMCHPPFPGHLPTHPNLHRLCCWMPISAASCSLQSRKTTASTLTRCA